MKMDKSKSPCHHDEVTFIEKVKTPLVYLIWYLAKYSVSLNVKSVPVQPKSNVKILYPIGDSDSTEFHDYVTS